MEDFRYTFLIIKVILIYYIVYRIIPALKISIFSSYPFAKNISGAI